MDMIKGKQLRERWTAAGSPNCAHERHDKERHELGADTGDRICLDCGATWWHTEPKPGPQAAAGY